MQRITIKHLMSLLPVLAISGCVSMGGGFSKARPHTDSDNYQLVEQSSNSVTGCQFMYRVYQPNSRRTSTSVVLGHGFLRDQDNMIDLSRAIANHGIQVVTLDFCNMRLWNGHHQRNAQDMRNLAKTLDIADDVIYAGFSAGALAAVLASDNDTRAIIALDFVDQEELGKKAISKLQIPLIGLAGPPSRCNANSHGNTLFSERADRSFSKLSKVSGASHCDFESPSNWLCEVTCGDKDNVDTARSNRENIIELTVTGLLPYVKPIE